MVGRLHESLSRTPFDTSVGGPFDTSSADCRSTDGLDLVTGTKELLQPYLAFDTGPWRATPRLSPAGARARAIDSWKTQLLRRALQLQSAGEQLELFSGLA